MIYQFIAHTVIWFGSDMIRFSSKEKIMLMCPIMEIWCTAFIHGIEFYTHVKATSPVSLLNTKLHTDDATYYIVKCYALLGHKMQSKMSIGYCVCTAIYEIVLGRWYLSATSFRVRTQYIHRSANSITFLLHAKAFLSSFIRNTKTEQFIC